MRAFRACALQHRWEPAWLKYSRARRSPLMADMLCLNLIGAGSGRLLPPAWVTAGYYTAPPRSARFTMYKNRIVSSCGAVPVSEVRVVLWTYGVLRNHRNVFRRERCQGDSDGGVAAYSGRRRAFLCDPKLHSSLDLAHVGYTSRVASLGPRIVERREHDPTK